MPPARHKIPTAPITEGMIRFWVRVKNEAP